MDDDEIEVNGRIVSSELAINSSNISFTETGFFMASPCPLSFPISFSLR